MLSDLREMRHCHRYLHLLYFTEQHPWQFVYIGQKNIKGSNIPNCMVVQFQMLFIIETIDNNSISHHASQALSSFSGPICNVFA